MNNENNDKYFKYLFDLQESGRTNMFGAGAYLEASFGLSRAEAKEVLIYWMNNHAALASKLGAEV